MEQGMQMRVAIIGGGIGGLATATGVHRAGGEATVFERADRLGGAGTALGLWPAALRALDQLGLGDRVREQAAGQRDGVFLRPDGSLLGRIDTAAIQRRTGDPVYLLSRPALLALLRGAVPAGAIRLGEPVDAAGLAELRRGYDVVVAADGILSAARTALFGPAHRARYLGTTAWRGVVDELATDTFSETWGPGEKFGITPQEGGRTNWFAAARAPEQLASPDGELAALIARFGGWHERVRPVRWPRTTGNGGARPNDWRPCPVGRTGSPTPAGSPGSGTRRSGWHSRSAGRPTEPPDQPAPVRPGGPDQPERVSGAASRGGAAREKLASRTQL